MELRLLGPVEVHAAGRSVPVGAPQRRAVLAALAVDVGRLVDRETLIDRVWDEPSARAVAAVYVHVTHLRRMLDQINADGDRSAPVSLDRRTGGYLLRLDPQEVDLHRFRRLVGATRAPDRPPADRVRLLRQAIALWRGPAFTGLSGNWVARMRESWEQERIAAMVAWAEAELLVDNPTAVLGPLTDLAGEYPFAEPVVGVLMRALSAAGHPAEGLEQYARMRRRLADELGTNPGPELQAIHQALLCRTVASAAPGPVATSAAALVPAQLPADVASFTGRDAELAQLDTLHAGRADEDAGAVVISAVAGTAGVGKTALAIRWAHRARTRFPDGQLYVNLRGYDVDQPASPGAVLARFLAALGVPSQDIPLDVDGRAARYRTEVAGRRMLIVLDNASSVEQVRPLLPGTGPSAVLVTSRDGLAGLVALHGARRLDLDLLPAAEALALLGRLIGARVEAEPAAAAALADRCAYLPLALRIAAELVASRPATALADLVTELTDQQQRLDLLAAGDDAHAAITTVFSWSIQHLPDDGVRAFRLIGLNPSPDFDAYATAALTDTTIMLARRSLDTLARAHLIHPTSRGRYTMHDLLRAYANRLATEHHTDSYRHAALTRLFDYYLATAAAAADHLYPAETHIQPGFPPATTPIPDIVDSDTARRWLEANYCALAAIAGYAANHGWPTHTVHLSRAVFRSYDGVHRVEASTDQRGARGGAGRTTTAVPDALHRNLIPHSARVYDYLLGGKDNFPADREFAYQLLEIYPEIRLAVRANRAFMRRAVRWLAGRGIRQFLDIGTGIPTSPNVHEVAQGVDPRSRVVYVDNDPLILAHARALLVSAPAGATAYIDADVRDTGSILTNPELRATLDLSQPVALSLIALLHFILDADDPYGIVARLVDELALGSYLVISHGSWDMLDAGRRAKLEQLRAANPIPFQPRSASEVARFLDGLEPVPPGVVPPMEWRNDDPGPRPSASEVAFYSAVARIP